MRFQEDADPHDLSDTAGGVQIDTTTVENSLAVPHEVGYPAISLLRPCMLKRSSCTYTTGDMTRMLVTVLPKIAKHWKPSKCSSA